jgi:hypothetical protein
MLQVFAAAGLKSPIAASIITGGVNLLFTIGAASVMDRCGCVVGADTFMHAMQGSVPVRTMQCKRQGSVPVHIICMQKQGCVSVVDTVYHAFKYVTGNQQ